MGKTEVPKVEYAKVREKREKPKLDSATQAALMRTTRPEVRDIILKVAEAYGLPIMGITILGGRPYVNVTGLDDKMKKRYPSEIEGRPVWIKSIVSTPIQRATKENKHFAGYTTEGELFNQLGFDEALKIIVQNGSPITSEIIKTLKEAYTIHFRAEGWASPDSCEGIAYKYEGPTGHKTKGKLLVENVNMMAERKSSNRMKRAATDTGLTSVEEVIGVDSGAIDMEFEPEKEAPKKEKPTAKKEPPAKKEAAGKEKVKEEAVAKEEPEEKFEKKDRPVQTSDVPFEKGAYDPKGHPTEWQWKRLDEIEERVGRDGWREILDTEGIVLESELTLEKADKIIKKHGIKKAREDELPLED